MSCLFVILKYLFVQILIFFVTPHSVTAVCDYGQFGQDHTMCQYNSPACEIIRGALNEEERHEILSAHNTARQKVSIGHQPSQPSASNMRELSWSDELAAIAQRWAEQCVYAHDHNRRTKNFKHVGQNIFESYSNKNKNTNADVKEAVQMWFDEVELFTANKINPFRFSKPIAHYTQLVWAEVDFVGCGFAYFQKTDRKFYKHTICNYAPGGNIINEAMYKIGPQCSRCDNGCSEHYPGLCNINLNEDRSDKNQNQSHSDTNDQEIISDKVRTGETNDENIRYL